MSIKLNIKTQSAIRNKICSECGEKKPLKQFYKRKTSPDGYRGKCKLCENSQKKVYRENNKDIITVRKKTYYENNKVRIAEQDKIYREKNKEKIFNRGKNYRENNKEDIAIKNKNYRIHNKDKLIEKEKIYYEANKDEISLKGAIYYKNNKDKINTRNINYYNNNKIRLLEKYKIYRENNKQKRTEYLKNKYYTDLEYRIILKIRNIARRAIKRVDGKKMDITVELLGCTPIEARKHIESQFTENMNWSNYGNGGWVIDHIRPIASFNNLKDNLDQQKQCCHYSNLQPLWEKYNLEKNSKWDG